MRALLCTLLVGSLVAVARAEPPPLTCAVEGVSHELRASRLCATLAQRLARSVSLVTDARQALQGEAIQLIHGDIDWVVIWLREGRVRTWTRVSKVDEPDEQLALLGRAARELEKQATPLPRGQDKCLRVDPNGSHKLRSTDLSYPWAELGPCKRKLVEVPDPWWKPEATR